LQWSQTPYHEVVWLETMNLFWTYSVLTGSDVCKYYRITRGGEINCPCCPCCPCVAPDKKLFPVDVSVDKWKNLISKCLFPNKSSQNRKFTNLLLFNFRFYETLNMKIGVKTIILFIKPFFKYLHLYL